MGKELAEFPVQLGSEGFVVAQHQGGPLGFGDHIGHGKGLTGTRHPQQGLPRHATFHSFYQLPDCFRLIAGGFVI